MSHFLRILLVSRSLPPAPTGSAVIVDNLSRAFSRDEMVLAGKEPPGGLPQNRSPELPPVVAVEGPRVWSIRGRANHHLALLRVPWLAARLARLIRSERCRAVVGVYPDAAYLYAAWSASRKTGTPFYPYFHNTYLECQRPGLLRAFARWLQPRVFRDAAHVFVMSEGMLELYRERYPDLPPASALVHSFNEPIPAPADPPPVRPEPVFALSGNVNGSCAEAARRLCQVVGRLPGAHLRFYTGQRQADLEQFGVWQPNATCQRLNRPDLLRALADSDILLLPHGFEGLYHPVEYRTIFPTKTIEYLISGRPILAHSPPGAFLTRFLKRHECALVVDQPDPAALAEAIRRLREDAALRARLVRAALQTAEQFQLPRVAARLREVALTRPNCAAA